MVPLGPSKHLHYGGQNLGGLLRPLCINSDPGPLQLFLFHMDPLNNGGGPKFYLQVPLICPPKPASGEDLAISGQHGLAHNSKAKSKKQSFALFSANNPKTVL